MVWMRLLCRRCRARWRMSSDALGGRGRCWLRPPCVRGVLFVLECGVLWRQG